MKNNKKFDEIVKNVRKVRDEMWQKALKQANGDIKKAAKIYSFISI